MTYFPAMHPTGNFDADIVKADVTTSPERKIPMIHLLLATSYGELHLNLSAPTRYVWEAPLRNWYRSSIKGHKPWDMNEVEGEIIAQKLQTAQGKLPITVKYMPGSNEPWIKHIDVQINYDKIEKDSR